MTHETPLDLIARKHLGLDTLETRKSDSLDFHDLAVWSIKAALQAAYEAGQASPAKQPRRAAHKPASSLPGAAEYLGCAARVSSLAQRLNQALDAHGQRAAAATACWGHAGDLANTERQLLEALNSLGGLTEEERTKHRI